MTNHSNPTALPASVDIESIVRRVLRQLESLKPSSQLTNPAGEFTFPQRVITLQDLKSVPASIKTIQVLSNAVLTPSVRDELRARRIEIVTTGERAASDATESKSSQPQGDHSPFRRVHLRHDSTIESTLFESVKKQLIVRRIRLCDQAGVTAILSSRPATAVYKSFSETTSAVLINRVDDVERFKAELRPTVYVLDVQHLHLVAITNAIIHIARRGETPITGVPRVTVSGGLR